MMNKQPKYILVDDSANATGGTELTLQGLVEDRSKDLAQVSSSQLSEQLIIACKDSIFIFGNIVGLYMNPQFRGIVNLLNEINYVKIEFDYNFCPYRCEYGHSKFAKEQCTCPYNTAPAPYAVLYETIQKTAKHIFFMSERQRAVYSSHIPIMPWHKTSVLSSCFSKDSLKLFESLRSNPKNDKCAILDGYSSWHREAKGVKQSIEYCNMNNLEFDILPQQPYEDHINLFSKYKMFVFLPIIHDTCPRCVIEAKLLDINVVTNYNSQHTTEYWFSNRESIVEYIKSRPKYFWSIVDSI